MNNDLTLRPAEGPLTVFSPQPTSLEEVKTFAELFSKSGYFQDTREMAQAATKIIYGQELGIPACTAMQNLHVISGKMGMNSLLIANLVKRSQKYNFRLLVWDDNTCSIQFFELVDRKWEECGPPSVFTRQDAAKAGTKNMDKFPKAMLYARAMSQGARAYCSDIFGGPVYTPEELGAAVNELGEPGTDRPALPPAPVVETTGNTVQATATSAEKKLTKDEEKARATKAGHDLTAKLKEYGFTEVKDRLPFISELLGENITSMTYSLCVKALEQPDPLWQAVANKLKSPKTEPSNPFPEDESPEDHGRPDDEGDTTANPT